MPARNIVKNYAPDHFYHIYNRGIAKQNIFKQNADYHAFLQLIKRYLGGEAAKDSTRHYYQDLSGELELLAYCLMPNHFHLLIYQYVDDAITKLMRRIMTGYAMYFNETYKASGRLFENQFKASLIENESYLIHISRYIHLNPLDIKRQPKSYPFSSYDYYLNNKQAKWVKPQRILDMHQKGSYEQFVNDYKAHKEMLLQVKLELASA